MWVEVFKYCSVGSSVGSSRSSWRLGPELGNGHGRAGAGAGAGARVRVKGRRLVIAGMR